MNSFDTKTDAAAALQQTGRSVAPQADLDPRLIRICCGNVIAPRLAEIRQPGEPTLFVSVWRCPKCKRITY